MESFNVKLTQNNRTTGKLAEEYAIKYLEQNGYVLLSVNWFFGHKELDIIIESDQYRIFVEVKSRVIKKPLNAIIHHHRSEFYNPITPENKVNDEKRRSILTCANHYNSLYPTTKEIRFDIVAITQKYYAIQLVHFKNAFSPYYSVNDRQNQVPFRKMARRRSKRWNVFYI